MQNNEHTNERVNCIETTKTDIMAENHQTSSKQEFNETFLSTNNLELQRELSQLIQNFNKINIKEIDPTLILSKQEYLSTGNDFNIIVDEINELIFKLRNKGIKKELEKQQVIEYFDDHNINLQEFYNWLLKNQVSTNSIFILGYFNCRGIVTNENNEKAFKLFINASEKNHILAQFFVGHCYLYGTGTIKNEKLSFEYFEKVANQNYAIGQSEIGYNYSKGIGIDKDLKKAFYWYEKAANNGNIIAMYNLGIYYENGEDVENYDKAFELFKQSAEGGHLNGIVMLGYCYDVGIGTITDKQKAFELYQDAAKLGHDIAQNNLALMYEEGDGITKDIDKAIYWYEKSAEQGNEGAKNKLEIILHDL
jgi:TPR repeat protein